MKKILSIDGGGMYGVIPVEVCIAIEDKLGKSLKQTFDLFVGTSTGSLISAAALRGLQGVNRPGMSAEEIRNIYLGSAEKIFGAGAKNRAQFDIPILNEGKYPKYNPSGLMGVINEVFGSGAFAEMEDTEKLIVTAYNVTDRKPHLFTSWGSDNTTLIKDAVMASSSVPKTHPLHEINGSYFTDGGVFASSPALLAYSEAKARWGDEELVLVSLGTGIPKVVPETGKPDDNISWWLKNIFKIFLDGQEESVDNALTNIANNPSNKLTYFRFDCEVEGKKGAETEVKVLEKASEIMRTELSNRAADFSQMINKLR
ncbi:MAG: patatin-like phospholipase family protein [Cyanobacteria bacterium P01_C01_bin.72]